MNSQEQAKKCAVEAGLISDCECGACTIRNDGRIAIIQRHLDTCARETARFWNRWNDALEKDDATEREKESHRELVKDRERLDWLEQNTTSIVAYNKGKKLIDSFIGNQKYRQAIDAAMKDTAMKGTKAEVER